MKFIPVTTFGSKYPLDDLVRPYLPRLVDTIMVSYQHAQALQPHQRPPLTLMIDSGGFASRLPGSLQTRPDGTAAIQVQQGSPLTPEGVLGFQERVADIAFTLDFMVLQEQPRREQQLRWHCTVQNALWAIQHKTNPRMQLYASLQAPDLQTAREAVRIYREHPFAGIGVGGLIPRLDNPPSIFKLLEAVLEEAHDLPVHAFGLGSPGLLPRLKALGVASSDSSSYVRWAAAGRTWAGPVFPGSLSPHGRKNLALQNLAELLKAI